MEINIFRKKQYKKKMKDFMKKIIQLLHSLQLLKANKNINQNIPNCCLIHRNFIHILLHFNRENQPFYQRKPNCKQRKKSATIFLLKAADCYSE
jgi:hypothetical protein